MKRVILALCTLLLLIGSLDRAYAQRYTRCGTLDRYLTALRLAKALYPSLVPQQYDFSFSIGYPATGPASMPNDGTNLQITVAAPGSWKTAKHESAESGETPGTLVPYHAADTGGFSEYGYPPEPEASADIGEQDLPMYLEFSDARFDSGVCTESFMSARNRKLERIRTLIASHPEWNATAALAAARELGMRFGPESKNTLLRRVPVKQLGNLYGHVLRVQSANFRLLPHAGTAISGDASSLLLVWDVTLAEQGSRCHLGLIVEPFDAHVVSVARDSSLCK